MEATARKKTTFLLNKKSYFLLFLFRRFLCRSILRSLEEDPAQKPPESPPTTASCYRIRHGLQSPVL
jgi:hypothetical protein